ncbi:MAG: hypothetical protein QOF85_1381 [Solirubrobacterales bacterium]|nr:hypothetical protein [Solirubrobacterales bacterium]
MKAKQSIALICIVVAAGLLVVGCGSSSSSNSSASTSSAPAGGTTTESQPASGGEAPSEAQAAATGDIPDNQVFLVFRDPTAGYSIRYPEGWARKGSGSNVTFQEKANTIHITVRKGAPHGKPGTKVTYSQKTAPDPVTGKRLRLLVDRYEYPHGGKVAVLDLATPEGVDNVDAYRLISKSFKWQG